MPDPSPTPTTPAASAVVFADPLLRRGLFTVVVAMATVVVGVAAAAFFLSFEAIRAFARHSGAGCQGSPGHRRPAHAAFEQHPA